MPNAVCACSMPTHSISQMQASIDYNPRGNERRYKLYIVGEVTVRVNHCLLALPGVKKSELKRVISHYQALAQVDGYTRKLPGVVREVVDDTAGAAQMIARNGWR